MNIFQKQTLVWGGIGAIAFTFIANSVKADTTVQDHYKNIIYNSSAIKRLVPFVLRRLSKYS